MMKIKRVLESHHFKDLQNVTLKNPICVVILDKAFLNFLLKYVRGNKEENHSPTEKESN